jgi:hypothetical protein
VKETISKHYHKLDELAQPSRIIRHLDFAERLVVNLDPRDMPIYNDHQECLTSVPEFIEYLRQLRLFNASPNAMSKFYAAGTIEKNEGHEYGVL